MIGNSSSAIIEAAYFSIPVVDIGTRQQGRGLTDNIFNCSYEKDDIKNSIGKVLNYSGESNKAFGGGKSSELFLDILNSDKIWKISKQKKFNYDN
jgi:UDP-N-acetylglucosamine 2-epimerase (hydrolysing)